jgi:hypothetical protein
MVAPFAGDVAKTFRKHFDFIVFVRKRGVFVTKEVPKKHDDITGKIHKAFRVEQVRIGMESLPKDLWEEYEQYSLMKKEEMRQDLGQVDRLKKDHMKEIFKAI